MNKKTSLMLSILGIISIVLIGTGLTYSFFNYAKEGTTENVMTSGSITFIYEEVDKQGAGIEIENAYPISDDNGKIQSASNEVFNFSVKSTTASSFSIPYTITARKDNSSTLDEEAVKLYLTEVSGETEIPLTENIYEYLPDYTNAPDGVSEKVLYTSEVPQGSTNYQKDYKLRMWIPSTISFSPDENDNYPYNNKTFKITVNVYANAKVVTVPEQPTEPVAFVPTYFEFGTPTTESTTDYTTLGKNVFTGLGEDNSIGVCIYKNEKLECFKNNNFEEESTHLVNVFGEEICLVDNTHVNCNDIDFTCAVSSDGHVSCGDIESVYYCDVYASDNVNCY